MVFEEETVPAVVVEHCALPFRDWFDEVGRGPGLQVHPALVGDVVYVYDVEDEDHVQLAVFGADSLYNLGNGADVWHFPNCDGLVRSQDFSFKFPEVFVHAWAIDVVFGAGVVSGVGAHGWFGVREALIFADEIDDVHPEATGSSFEPEVHDILNGGADVWIFPIQVRLFGREEGEVVFIR